MPGQLPTTGLMLGLPKQGDHPSVCGFGGCLLWLGTSLSEQGYQLLRPRREWKPGSMMTPTPKFKLQNKTLPSSSPLGDYFGDADLRLDSLNTPLPASPPPTASMPASGRWWHPGEKQKSFTEECHLLCGSPAAQEGARLQGSLLSGGEPHRQQQTMPPLCRAC